MTTSPAPTADDRAADIRAAALGVFAEHGFRRTSMAMIAEAVGVSRPALYQYFDNREDVFRAVIADAYNAAADRALEALQEHEHLATALDVFLQRAHADGYHELSMLKHRDEILEASGSVASGEAAAGVARMHAGLRARLLATGASRDLVESAVTLLALAPGGLKSDEPDSSTLRERLRDLAEAVAALIEASPQASRLRPTA